MNNRMYATHQRVPFGLFCRDIAEVYIPAYRTQGYRPHPYIHHFHSPLPAKTSMSRVQVLDKSAGAGEVERIARFAGTFPLFLPAFRGWSVLWK